MTTADASRWTKRNVWRLPSGELCVRPGLRRVYAPESGRAVVAGFTVENYFAGEVWHYIFDVATTTTGAVDAAPSDLRLLAVDENFQTIFDFPIQSSGVPRAVSHAVVEGQILICSPDFPTLWGLVGSHVRIAVGQVSKSGQAIIAVPRGLVTRWANRAVVALGPSLYVGDPVVSTGGDMRSFIGANQSNRPASVYGIHEAAGGMLIALTADGVWALDDSASGVGIVGSTASWRLLHHHRAQSYDSSCVVRGRVYALTRRGWSLVDVEDGDEVSLDDPEASRALAPRVASADYRPARVYGGEDGPIVALDAEDAIHVTDVARNLSAWWTSSVCGMRMRGLLRRNDGGEFLLCEDGAWHVSGNLDDDSIDGGSGTAPIAVLSGSVDATPDVVRNVRRVFFSSAGSPVGCSARGQTAKSATPPADTAGLTVGSGTWGQSGRRYTVTPLRSVRFQWDESAEPSVEFSAAGGGARIDPTVAFDPVDTIRPDVEG